jgi:GR25 family glycosyltransferase involved in LPS biosynthesis
MRLAERAIQSAGSVGVRAELFDAVERPVADRTRRQLGLEAGPLAEEYCDRDAATGCFLSMYLLWRRIRERNAPAIILEHDAVFTARPDLDNPGEVVNLGRPSYGEYREKDEPGVYPLFSKEGGYFPGSHGYYVTPTGADRLIRAAHRDGVQPADLFLSIRRFPWLKEIYPWVVEARSDFSTVQNEAGARAQHCYQRNRREDRSFRTVNEIWQS